MAGWQFYRSVTINGPSFNAATGRNMVPSADITDYVLLFTGTYSWLATAANGGKIQTPNGTDIAFTADALGTVLLPFERTAYKAATGQVEFHIRIPLVSHSVNTVIYIQYGQPSGASDVSNRAGVWESAYVGVYHFGDGVTLDLTDSTSYGNHGSNVGGATAGAGIIGVGGVSLSSALSQYISVPGSPSIDNAGSGPGLILQAAYKLASAAPAILDRPIVGKLNNVSGYSVYQRSSTTPGGDGALYFLTEPGCSAQAIGSQSTAGLGIGAAGYLWYELAANGGTPLHHTLEIEFGTQGLGANARPWQGATPAVASTGIALNIGFNQYPTNPCHNGNGWGPWDGVIDEVRIRVSPFPDDGVNVAGDPGINRMVTEWNNFQYTVNFYTIGAENTGTFSAVASSTSAKAKGQGGFCATPTITVPIRTPMFRLRNGREDAGGGQNDARLAGSDDPGFLNIPDSASLTRPWIIFFEQLAQYVCASEAGANPNPGNAGGGALANGAELAPSGMVLTDGRQVRYMTQGAAALVFP